MNTTPYRSQHVHRGYKYAIDIFATDVPEYFASLLFEETDPAINPHGPAVPGTHYATQDEALDAARAIVEAWIDQNLPPKP